MIVVVEGEADAAGGVGYYGEIPGTLAPQGLYQVEGRASRTGEIADHDDGAVRYIAHCFIKAVEYLVYHVTSIPQ